jgi:hypothetical protein
MDPKQETGLTPAYILYRRKLDTFVNFVVHMVLLSNGSFRIVIGFSGWEIGPCKPSRQEGVGWRGVEGKSCISHLDFWKKSKLNKQITKY